MRILLMVFLMWGGVARADEVVVTPALCDQVMVHVMEAGVAYEPTFGVAPADLDGGVDFQLPDHVTLPIEVDMKKYYEFSGDPGAIDEDVDVGDVTVGLKDDQILFNGKPINTKSQADLIAACQKMLSNPFKP